MVSKFTPSKVLRPVCSCNSVSLRSLLHRRAVGGQLQRICGVAHSLPMRPPVPRTSSRSRPLCNFPSCVGLTLVLLALSGREGRLDDVALNPCIAFAVPIPTPHMVPLEQKSEYSLLQKNLAQQGKKSTKNRNFFGLFHDLQKLKTSTCLAVFRKIKIRSVGSRMPPSCVAISRCGTQQGMWTLLTLADLQKPKFWCLTFLLPAVNFFFNRLRVCDSTHVAHWRSRYCRQIPDRQPRPIVRC